MAPRYFRLLTLLGIIVATVAPAAAQEHGRDEGHRDQDRHAEVWRDHDIRRFHEHDFDRSLARRPLGAGPA